MATALWIVFWVLAALLVLLIIALATPTLFFFEAAFGHQTKARLSIRPLGGLAPRIPVFDSTTPAKPKKPKPKDEAQAAKPRKRRTKRRFTTNGQMVRAVPRLVGELLGTVHIEDLSVDLDVGTNDPADTGSLYGGLTPFIYGTWAKTGGSVTIRPDFTGPRLDGTASARLRFTPASVLPPAMRFAWTAFGPAR